MLSKLTYIMLSIASIDLCIGNSIYTNNMEEKLIKVKIFIRVIIEVKTVFRIFSKFKIVFV